MLSSCSSRYTWIFFPPGTSHTATLSGSATVDARNGEKLKQRHDPCSVSLSVDNSCIRTGQCVREKARNCGSTTISSTSLSSFSRGTYDHSHEMRNADDDLMASCDTSHAQLESHQRATVTRVQTSGSDGRRVVTKKTANKALLNRAVVCRTNAHLSNNC